MLLFCFVLLFLFTDLPKPNSGPRPKLERKDNPYLKEIEAKFQRDLLRGFGCGGILPHL